MLKLLFQSPRNSDLGSEETDDDALHWQSLKDGGLQIDMYERPDAIVVRAHAAGVEPDNLHISIHNDLLTIRGERREDEMVADENYYARECAWGAFQRTVVIPAAVQAEQIRAFFKNGIVTIELPKVQEEDDSSSYSDEDDSSDEF